MGMQYCLTIMHHTKRKTNPFSAICSLPAFRGRHTVSLDTLLKQTTNPKQVVLIRCAYGISPLSIPTYAFYWQMDITKPEEAPVSNLSCYSMSFNVIIVIYRTEMNALNLQAFVVRG